MKIVFEIPSHSYAQSYYIHSVANETKSEDIGFVIASNGPEFEDDFKVKESNFVISKFKRTINDPCVSMVELRSKANEVATEFFPESKFRIMADHNFEFCDGWEEFVLEAVNDMERFTQITDYDCYLSMSGHFGSVAKGRKTHISRQPIFPMNRGIIYSTKFNPWSQMTKLPGSLEEAYMTSILFLKGQMPLKKFLSPIKHSMNVNDNGKGLYDRDLWMENNGRMIQELWNDPYWINRPKYTDKTKPEMPYYYANYPKSLESRLHERLKRIDKSVNLLVHEFI